MVIIVILAIIVIIAIIVTLVIIGIAIKPSRVAAFPHGCLAQRRGRARHTWQRPRGRLGRTDASLRCFAEPKVAERMPASWPCSWLRRAPRSGAAKGSGEGSRGQRLQCCLFCRAWPPGHEMQISHMAQDSRHRKRSQSCAEFLKPQVCGRGTPRARQPLLSVSSL